MKRMKLYTWKYKIKVLLFTLAILFVAVIIFLLNNTIHNIKQEERKQVMLWAEAVQKKYSLVEYTGKLFEKLKAEERKKVELWSEAQYYLLDEDNSHFLTFLLKIISSNKNIPIILTDSRNRVVSSINLDFELELNKPMPKDVLKRFSQYAPIPVTYENEPINYLYYTDSRLFSELQEVMNNMIRAFIEEVVRNSASVPVIITNHDTSSIIAYGNIDSLRVMNDEVIRATLQEMSFTNTPIPIVLNNEITHYIFYEDSMLITRLRYYPLVLIAISILLLALAYLAFRSSEKYEQNQILVGMSKETAHQLGTPISSLMAWLELLKIQNIDPEVLTEINKDVVRLHTIADRFSKIGSTPHLSSSNVYEVVKNAIEYIKMRTSNKVHFQIYCTNVGIMAPLNIPLFDWVIENICKNAIDAMQGAGNLDIHISQGSKYAYIDIEDTGKGIARNKFKTIFQPGYSTKQRGWGLGLSLAKRIVSQYHGGRIVVKSSEINRGTTFRISLPLSQS